MPHVLRSLSQHCHNAAIILKLVLAHGHPISFELEDSSMRPYLAPGDVLKVGSVEPAALRAGDLVYCKVGGQLRVRRVVRYLGAGDAAILVVASEADCWEVQVPVSDLVGRVLAVRRHGRCVRHRGVGYRIA